MSNLNYIDLIAKAIGDFDSIFLAMKNRKVLNLEGTAELTAAERDTGLKTADYATIISRDLFRIDGITTSKEGISTIIANNTIDKYEDGKVESLAPTLVRDTTSENGLTYNVTVPVKTAGYYDTTSKLISTIQTKQLTNVGEFSLSGNSYEYATGANESLVSKVSISKGSVSVANWADAYSENFTYSSNLSIVDSDLSEGKVLVSAPTTNTSDWLAVELAAELVRNGTFTVTPTKNVVEGYVKSADVELGSFTKEFEDAKIDDTLGGAKVYIKKGTVSIDESKLSDVATTISGDFAWGTSESDGYLITATAAQSGSTSIALEGDVEEGYLKTSNNKVNLGTIKLESGSKYIKKATVQEDATVELALGEITSKEGILGSSGYAISVSGTANASGVVTAGYVKDDTTYSGTDTKTKTAYIAHGKFDINASASATIESSIGKVVESIDGIDTDKNYIITATPVIDNNSKDGFTEGYIKRTDITDGTKSTTAKYLSISKASAAISNGLSVSFKNVASDTDAPNEDMESVEIFLGSAPTDRDYYIVNSSADITSFTAGYLAGESEIVIGANATKYLPKADIKLFEDSDGNLVVDVERAGYLPSGILSTDKFDTTDTLLSPASVILTIDTNKSDTIFSTSGNDDAYKLELKKGSSTAGYISDTTGTVSGAFYVAKGSVTIDHTVGELTVSDVSKATSGKYHLTVSGSCTDEVKGFTAGYVTRDDITLSGNETIYKDVELTAGSVEYSSNNLAITADLGSGLEAGTASNGFAITPRLVSGKITVDTAVAGYISEEDSFDIPVSNDVITTKDPVYIKAGTGVTISSVADTLVATADFGDAVSGAYTVTVTGTANVSGSIGTGYYDATKTVVTSNSHELAGTTLSVAHGSVDVECSVSNDLRSNDVKFLEAGSTAKSVTINAIATSITHDVSVVPGYVKEADVVVAENAENAVATSITKKIAAVDLTEKTVGEETFYDVKVGQTEAYILDTAATKTVTDITATKEAYSKYTTKVTLTEHAMGSSVILELKDLEARLNGTLVRS